MSCTVISHIFVLDYPCCDIYALLVYFEQLSLLARIEHLIRKCSI